MRRRVTAVMGQWENDKDDFVLEPACPEECNCEICEDAFWIEKVIDTDSNAKMKEDEDVRN